MQKSSVPYAELRSTGENAFFLASNSASGFHSYYENYFNRPEINRIYAIKGGPGTGKSRLMREVAECGEKKGYSVDYIYCSSDADSLDAVTLWKNGTGTALLDATAPHVFEPSHIGYREEIINLGGFWDSSKLREQTPLITRLEAQKKEAYRDAYSCLSVCGTLQSLRNSMIDPFTDTFGLQKTAARLMQKIPSESNFSESVTLQSSVGMKGNVSFDTFCASASVCYVIPSYRGLSSLLLSELYRIAKEKKLSVRVSRDPLLPDRLDGLYLCNSKIAFVTGIGSAKYPYPHKILSLDRFLDRKEMLATNGDILSLNRQQLHLAWKSVQAAFQRVSAAHFALEKIYSAAMNFPVKEAFSRTFCRLITEN